MFLNRLIARAAGTASVLKPTTSLAKELDDPTWGPVAGTDAPEPDPVGDPAEELRQDHKPRPRPATRPAQSGADVVVTTPKPLPSAPVPLTAVAPPQPVAAAPDIAKPHSPALILAATQPVVTRRQIVQDSPRLHSPHPQDRVLPETVPDQSRGPTVPLSPAADPPANRQPLLPALKGQDHAAPPPAGPAPTPSDRIEVHVDIGRLDLVSPQSSRPRPAPQSRAARPGPSLSLADYLDQRRGDRR